jgi:hypothetical protein
MSIEHKSTAKASLRDLLSAHGKAGVLLLLGEVLREQLPTRRGRPTRAEAVTRIALAGLEKAYQAVANAEDVLQGKDEAE